MRPFWSDPYLWVHLAGVAVVPISLELCWLGLAMGEPMLPPGVELLVVGMLGIAPVLWMQWQRPFCIFCLLLLALKPNRLTDDQRRLLRLFKAPENRVLTGMTAAFLLWVLWQLDQLAPLAAAAAAPFNQDRVVGLLIAAIAFASSNLFLQVPVSVLRVLFARQATVAMAEPYPVDQISTDFTLIGWPVKQILPPLTVSSPKAAMATDPMPVNDEASQSSNATTLDPDLDTGIERAEIERAASQTTAALSSVEPDGIEQDGIDQAKIEQPAEASDVALSPPTAAQSSTLLDDEWDDADEEELADQRVDGEEFSDVERDDVERSQNHLLEDNDPPTSRDAID